MQNVFEIATKYIGVKEISGSANNPIIENFFKSVTGYKQPDETAWCAAFVGHCLVEAGLKSSGKLNARSYLKWGVRAEEPKQGDIVIFWRGSPASWQGHVGFYVGETQNSILVLGGNQNNQVSIAEYPKDRLLDIRTKG